MLTVLPSADTTRWVVEVRKVEYGKKLGELVARYSGFGSLQTVQSELSLIPPRADDEMVVIRPAEGARQ